MELKKTPKADLNNKRGYFFQIGAIVALFFVIVLFSWSASEQKIEMMASAATASEMEQAEITIQENKPEPVMAAQVVMSDLINVVKNDAKITQDLSILDFDMNADISTDNMKYSSSTAGETLVEEETPVVFAEEMPTFQGKDGQVAFSAWCQANLTYPQIAADNGVQGRVMVSFVVEPNGKLSNIKILRGQDKYLDQAALDIVAKAPTAWKPARNNGRPVRLMIQMPIQFQLRQ